MNRRSFLRLLGSAAPVAAVAPTYFFAPVGGWLASPKIDPRISEYQRMLDRFCEQISAAVPSEQFYYMHPANKETAERLFNVPARDLQRIMASAYKKRGLEVPLKWN